MKWPHCSPLPTAFSSIITSLLHHLLSLFQICSLLVMFQQSGGLLLEKRKASHENNQQITSCSFLSPEGLIKLKILLNQNLIQKLNSKVISENLPSGASILLRQGEGTLSLSSLLTPNIPMLLTKKHAYESCRQGPFTAPARSVDYIELKTQTNITNILVKSRLKICMGQKSKHDNYRKRVKNKISE